MEQKNKRGRPAGSGEQLPAGDRVRRSRAERAKAGGIRIDFTLLGESADQLTWLMQQWESPHRKDAVERAVSIVYQTMQTKRSKEST